MNIKLRQWRVEDIPLLVKYANNPQVARNLTDGFPQPYTAKDGEDFIRMAMQIEPSSLLAITFNNVLAGSIGIYIQTDIHRKNAELGYFLAEEFWGKGIMTEAVKQMVEYTFAHFDVTRIFARPFGTNRASQKVLEKAGFTLEAHFKKALFKNNQFIDELIYAIRKESINCDLTPV